MAKETVIVFVYDMEYCKAEEDDPAKAVLYFHPSWVSEQQKVNLCGQIVGATHFLSITFSPPKFISLQSGRFHLTVEDRYLIVVGTDRNVDDWILERRSNIIMSLLKFFHGDLTSVAEQTQNYNNLCEKLYSMFETYLKILYFSANIFSNTPLLNLPKSASSVFLEAIQILQYCQEMDTVLGGALLYHNKVLATQLDADLTKMLVITDPYRIKSSAEIVHTEYNLPLGVQLMYVYIPYRKHINLSRDSARLRSLSDPASWAPQKKNSVPKTKEQTFSAMKRDQSLLFTTVPEEDSESHTSPNDIIQPEPFKPIEKKIEPFEKPTFDPPKTNRPNRPKSLNLKLTNNTDSNPPKPKFTKTESVTTPFNYKTSVCSTPLTEKYLHFKPHNIISDADIEMIEFKNNGKLDKTESVNSILSLAEKNAFKKDLNTENFDVQPSDFILPTSKIFDLKKSNSFHILNKIFQDDSQNDTCQCPNETCQNYCCKHHNERKCKNSIRQCQNDNCQCQNDNCQCQNGICQCQKETYQNYSCKLQKDTSENETCKRQNDTCQCQINTCQCRVDTSQCQNQTCQCQNHTCLCQTEIPSDSYKRQNNTCQCQEKNCQNESCKCQNGTCQCQSDTCQTKQNVSCKSYNDKIDTCQSLKPKNDLTIEKNGNASIFMRSYGLGLLNLTPDFNSDSNKSVKNDNFHLYNTITDPNFPIFRSNGTLVSKNLYDFYLAKHYDLFNPDFLIDSNLNSVTNTEDWKSLDDFDSEFRNSPKKINKINTNFETTAKNEKTKKVDSDSCQMSQIVSKIGEKRTDSDDLENCNFKREIPNFAIKNLSISSFKNDASSVEDTLTETSLTELSKIDSFSSNDNLKLDKSELSLNLNLGPKALPNGSRPPLTLPLKSLSTENEPQFTSFSRKSNGVQLTPLMSKLSLLAAIEDRSSGFCSRDTTPMTEFRDLMTPSDKNYSFLRRGSIKKMESFESDDDDEFKKSVLFVCGQQDTVLALLLEENAVENEKLIRDLWEICIDNLGQLETQLRQCLEQYPGATNGTSEISEDDTYSYLCLDPHWEATRRGGPWAISELGMLNQMHREFKKASDIVEISLRNEDGIVYGYRCGETEVYYQQAAPCNPGLPPPADAMGVAPLKAKRKLERDHGIILL